MTHYSSMYCLKLCNNDYAPSLQLLVTRLINLKGPIMTIEKRVNHKESAFITKEDACINVERAIHYNHTNAVFFIIDFRFASIFPKSVLLKPSIR